MKIIAMKEFLTDTLELEKFIEYDSLLKKNNILKKFIQTPNKSKFGKLLSINDKINIKDPDEFSSLERISIVLDYKLDRLNIEQICQREQISKSTFLKWENDFLKAFNKYSEEFLINEKFNLSTKELLLKESSKEVVEFYERFVDLYSTNNLVISKEERLAVYSNFNTIKNIFVLDKINNFRQINKHLEQVNEKLPYSGLLMGCFETCTSRAQHKSIYRIPLIKHIYFGFEFIFKRVFPKLPVFKKFYFYVTKGRNRLLSKAEALGRLVSCGFDILDYIEIDSIHYFVAKKVNEPAYDMSPSYGPLFQMKRIGKNGKIIGVYKFRTMHPYSEYLQDYILKLNGYADTGKPANDFRLVPYAKFIRRFWLDEIPQLLNLIKGDMKLVGCRPVSERYFQDIPKEIQKLRLTQKPGCIPPYVSLNRNGSVESVLQAEKQYLEEKIKNPYLTDLKYFFKALYNIVIRNKRSA